MSPHRIVSLLPAATEMACALGLEDQLVGISHECDFPPSVRSRPAVVRPALPVETMTPAEIDAAVTARLRTGASLYVIDETLLRSLQPTLILTQDLCQVCAPSGNEISQVLKGLAPRPQVLFLTPKSLAGVDENLRELARATGKEAEAEALLKTGRGRLARVEAQVAGAPRPKVFCLEWIDPLYCSGHWVSEMVELAGGTDALSRRGTDSVRIPFADVAKWAPEVLVVMPCGYHLAPALAQAQQLLARPEWAALPAAGLGKVYAADANAYFARPGPRLVEGVELLAHLLHPQLVPWTGPKGAFQRVALPAAARA